MDIQQLQQLITKGESNRLEFKKSTTQIKAAFETLCGFLNSDGGTILLGVADNGRIVGQQVSDNTRQEIAREISKIEPTCSADIDYVDVANNKQVIIIQASRGNYIPYVYDGRSFERNQSTTVRMSQHRYEQLIIQRGQLNHSWEKFPARDFTIDDLDHEEIRCTVEEGVNKQRISPKARTDTIEQVLINFDLIEHDELTNAAVALYAKDESKILSQCEIKMARFRGIDKLGDFIDNQWLYGNLFQLITAAHHFTSRHLPIASFFEPGKLQRIDQPAIPVLALREALINAFCHRDYTDRSTTSLAIYDDRLEIWNPGKLPHQLKIENLKVPHRSVLRNKVIAQVFYKRGWIETWGTGTLRMAEYCKNNQTPAPEFKEEFGGFSVIFPFNEPMHTQVIVKQTIKIAFTLRQKEIISILEQYGEMSLSSIREHMQKPPAVSTLREDLTTLKSNRVLDSRGKARATTWFLMKNPF